MKTFKPDLSEPVAQTPADFTLPTPSFHAEQAPEPSPSRRNPQKTMVSSVTEADDLRRRIALPGMPEVEEIDLEEIEELDALHPQPFAAAPDEMPAPPTETVAPGPPLGRAGTAEVEVPIDIQVAPGTTQVTLKLRLVLNLRRR